MFPDLITLFGYTVPTYGAAILGAFLVCGGVFLWHFPRELFDMTDALSFCLIVVLAVLLGGPFLDRLWQFTLPDASTLLPWQDREMASYPALVATLILIYLYCRWAHLPWHQVLDILVPYALVALAIQRLFGCFMAGCCHGVPTDLPWGVTFPSGSPGAVAFPGQPLHPTQLYYALSALLVWGGLVVYGRWARRPFAGDLAALGVLGLSVTYLAIAPLRGDGFPGLDHWMDSGSVPFALGLSLWSIALFLWPRLGRMPRGGAVLDLKNRSELPEATTYNRSSDPGK
jgi:phosphatidylglycerol:prolipoprotein diacylglycerol transferase